MSNTIVSSRIRFARNLSTMPFPRGQSDAQATHTAQLVSQAIKDFSPNYSFLRLSDASDLDLLLLHEKHLISEALISNRRHGHVLISDDEQVSVMVNEEDHIRAQCILPDLRLIEAHSILSELDGFLAEALPYAVSPRYGHLTSCLTNVGSAMRASAMMFLPGLAITNSLDRNISIAGNFKIAIRGIYGEGSRSESYLYQISNQQTLGITDQEIISNVTNVIRHIEQAEANARQILLQSREINLRDDIGRAYGILCHAYKLERNEFMHYLALVRLGAGLNLLDISTKKLDRLLNECQNANIRTICGSTHPDIFRAKYVSKILMAD